MAYVFLPQFIAGALGVINPAVAVTAFGNAPNTIAGVNLGVGVVRGDSGELVGSISNDAAYVVLDVIDANTIEVFPAPTVEAAAGTLTIREQNNFLVIQDEAVVSAASIAAAMALLDSRLFELKFTTPAQTAGREFRIYGFLIRVFFFNNTVAATTDLLSENEVWFLDWDGAQRSSPGIASEWFIAGNNTAVVGAQSNINFGSLADPLDPRSVQNGSVLLGGSIANLPNGELSISIYGSYLHSGASQLFYVVYDGPGEGALAGSIVNAGLIAPNSGGTLETLQTVIHNSPNFGIAPLGPIASAANFLQADSSNFGIIFSAVEVILREVELSDAAFNPMQFLFNSAAQFIDPREDYTAAELFQLSNSAAAKSYTFNPRFTDINFVTGPSPLVGAEVSIERVSDGHYMRVLNQTDGTYTITINGVDHTHISVAQSVPALRSSLVAAINAGSEPVSSVPATTLVNLGNNAFIINADVADTPFTIVVTTEPAPGDLEVDQPPQGGAALVLQQDYREIPIPGSPFTVDGNGRINTNGVEIAAFVGYETGLAMRFINLQYRIIVEGNGFRRVLDGFKPTAPFLADFPVEDKAMGEFRP